MRALTASLLHLMLYPLGLPSKETFPILQMGEMAFKRGSCYCTPDKERCLEFFFFKPESFCPYQLCDPGPVVLPLSASVPSSKRSWLSLVMLCTGHETETSAFPVGQCSVSCAAHQSRQGAQNLLLLLIGFHAALCYAGLQFFWNHSSNASSFAIVFGLKKNCKKKKKCCCWLIFEAGFQLSRDGLELFT